MSEKITIDGDLADAVPEGDGPLVMVNLLRFRAGGGSKSYGRYAAAFAELLEKAGGRFVFRGRVEAGLIADETWHAVALVEYPSREVFLELIGSEAYQAIHEHRHDGLEATQLLATRAYPSG